MSAGRILLVEDDEALGRQIVGHLKDAGFEVEWLQDGAQAAQRSPRDFVLVILDLMLPGMYGLDILKEFRKVAEVPILILSARDQTQDKVRGLKLGADDYLTKPFWPEELVARCQACLRRPVYVEQGDVYRFANLELNRATRQARVGTTPVELTPTELLCWIC